MKRDLFALPLAQDKSDAAASSQLSRRQLIRTTSAGLVVGGLGLLSQQSDAQAAGTSLGKVLVAYFSRTGNTRAVATQIHDAVGGDLFEVHTHPYPEAYRATTDEAKREQEANARPPLLADVDAIERYDTVFLGYPNWWSTVPMVFFTFLERHHLDTKTIVPFCTHEGSRLGQSAEDIQRLCPKAKLLTGLALRGGNSGYAQSDAGRRDVADWLRRL